MVNRISHLVLVLAFCVEGTHSGLFTCTFSANSTETLQIRLALTKEEFTNSTALEENSDCFQRIQGILCVHVFGKGIGTCAGSCWESMAVCGREVWNKAVAILQPFDTVASALLCVRSSTHDWTRAQALHFEGNIGNSVCITFPSWTPSNPFYVGRTEAWALSFHFVVYSPPDSTEPAVLLNIPLITILIDPKTHRLVLNYLSMRSESTTPIPWGTWIRAVMYSIAGNWLFQTQNIDMGAAQPVPADLFRVPIHSVCLGAEMAENQPHFAVTSLRKYVMDPSILYSVESIHWMDGVWDEVVAPEWVYSADQLIVEQKDVRISFTERPLQWHVVREAASLERQNLTLSPSVCHVLPNSTSNGSSPIAAAVCTATYNEGEACPTELPGWNSGCWPTTKVHQCQHVFNPNAEVSILNYDVIQLGDQLWDEVNITLSDDCLFALRAGICLMMYSQCDHSETETGTPIRTCNTICETVNQKCTKPEIINMYKMEDIVPITQFIALIECSYIWRNGKQFFHVGKHDSCLSSIEGGVRCPFPSSPDVEFESIQQCATATPTSTPTATLIPTQTNTPTRTPTIFPTDTPELTPAGCLSPDPILANCRTLRYPIHPFHTGWKQWEQQLTDIMETEDLVSMFNQVLYSKDDPTRFKRCVEVVFGVACMAQIPRCNADFSQSKMCRSACVEMMEVCRENIGLMNQFLDWDLQEQGCRYFEDLDVYGPDDDCVGLNQTAVNAQPWGSPKTCQSCIREGGQYCIALSTDPLLNPQTLPMCYIGGAPDQFVCNATLKTEPISKIYECNIWGEPMASCSKCLSSIDAYTDLPFEWCEQLVGEPFCFNDPLDTPLPLCDGNTLRVAHPDHCVGKWSGTCYGCIEQGGQWCPDSHSQPWCWPSDHQLPPSTCNTVVVTSQHDCAVHVAESSVITLIVESKEEDIGFKVEEWENTLKTIIGVPDEGIVKIHDVALCTKLSAQQDCIINTYQVCSDCFLVKITFQLSSVTARAINTLLQVFEFRVSQQDLVADWIPKQPVVFEPLVTGDSVNTDHTTDPTTDGTASTDEGDDNLSPSGRTDHVEIEVESSCILLQCKLAFSSLAVFITIAALHFL